MVQSPDKPQGKSSKPRTYLGGTPRRLTRSIVAVCLSAASISCCLRAGASRQDGARHSCWQQAVAFRLARLYNPAILACIMQGLLGMLRKMVNNKSGEVRHAASLAPTCMAWRLR